MNKSDKIKKDTFGESIESDPFGCCPLVALRYTQVCMYLILHTFGTQYPPMKTKGGWDLPTQLKLNRFKILAYHNSLTVLHKITP